MHFSLFNWAYKIKLRQLSQNKRNEHEHEHESLEYNQFF